MKNFIFLAVLVGIALFAYFTWKRKTPADALEEAMNNPVNAPLIIVPSAPIATPAPAPSPSVVTKAASLTTGIKPAVVSQTTLASLNQYVAATQPVASVQPQVSALQPKQFTL
jgi:hypothetical protein